MTYSHRCYGQAIRCSHSPLSLTDRRTHGYIRSWEAENEANLEPQLIRERACNSTIIYLLKKGGWLSGEFRRMKGGVPSLQLWVTARCEANKCRLIRAITNSSGPFYRYSPQPWILEQRAREIETQARSLSHIQLRKIKLSPSTLWITVRHTLCEKPYGRKVLSMVEFPTDIWNVEVRWK
jgi:hypothetical protein